MGHGLASTGVIATALGGYKTLQPQVAATALAFWLRLLVRAWRSDSQGVEHLEGDRH
jgi:hypothetical protein